MRLNRHQNAPPPPELGEYPADRYRWDAEVRSVYDYTPASVTNAGQSDDAGDARRLYTNAGSSGYVVVSAAMDLSSATHLDLIVDVRDPSVTSNLGGASLELGDSSFSNKLTLNFATELRYPPTQGRRVLRFAVADLSQTGTPDLGALTHLRAVITAQVGQEAEVYLVGLRSVRRTHGVVHLCFDDAVVSQYQHAFPIMEQYGLRGTVGVITGYVGQLQNVGGDDYDCMTWAQIAELEAAGWAVASHTSTHPSLAGKTVAQLEGYIGDAHDALVAQGFALGAKGLICPFGSWDVNVHEVAQNYHLWVRSEGSGQQVFPPRDAMYGGHYSALASDSAQDLTDMVDAAIANAGLMTFALHRVLPTLTGAYDYEVSTATFEALCAHIRNAVDAGDLDCLNWYDLMGFESPSVVRRQGHPYRPILP